MVTVPSGAGLDKGNGGGKFTDWLKVTLEPYGLLCPKSVSARRDLVCGETGILEHIAFSTALPSHLTT